MTFEANLMTTVERIRELAYEERMREHMRGFSEAGPENQKAESAQYSALIAGEFDYIPTEFTPFLGSDLGSLDHMIADLDTVAGKYSTVPSSEVTSLLEGLTGWKSDAAKEVRTYFAGSLIQAADNQAWLASELRSDLLILKETLTATQDAVNKIATTTVDALVAMSSGRSTDWRVSANVVKSVLEICATLAAPPAFIPFTLTAAAQLIGLATMATVEGQTLTVDRTLDLMHESLQSVLRERDQVERGLMARFMNLESQINAVLASDKRGLFYPPRPAVIDDPGSFKPPKGSVYE